jgi:hypothetical protein
MFEEEMKKVLVFIRGFQPIERVKLARMTALWIGKFQAILALLQNGSIDAFPRSHLEHDQFLVVENDFYIILW